MEVERLKVKIICIMCNIEFIGERGDSYCSHCWEWRSRRDLL